MKTLSNDWITEGLIDAEYKSYVLMAYLTTVGKEFKEQKLFPGFSDLVQHYQNLLSVKTGRDQLKKAFPKELDRADWENFQLEFKDKTNEDEFMMEMDRIIDYSIPVMQSHLEDGKSLYQFVEQHLNISPVGLASLSSDEGFFFLLAPPKKTTRIYFYQSAMMHMPDGQYRAIHVNYVDEVSLGFTSTLESIKLDLLRTYKKPTVPATYVIESEILVPWNESLLPVAKRSLVEYLAKI